MNRIIHVEYTDEDRIPQEFQLANLRSYMKDMASDILNRAAHAPRDLFQFHIRNQYYKVYAEIEKNDQALGFEAFLIDEFIYDGTKDAFTSLDNIETKMKTYYENVSDPIFEGVLKARSSKRVIQDLITRVAYEKFGLQLKAGRYTKRDAQRPYGIKYLLPKPREGIKLTSTQKYFQRQPLEDLAPPLPQNFFASQSISWVQSKENDFLQTQMEILKHRQIVSN